MSSVYRENTVFHYFAELVKYAKSHSAIAKWLRRSGIDGESPRDRHRRIQTAVLRSKHQELREKLNFISIYPHLNAHGLLPPTLDQVELVGQRVWGQVDRVIAYMPNCSKLNFLDEFIVCLKKSTEGTGDAHMELVQSLEAAYKCEMELKFVSPERGIII